MELDHKDIFEVETSEVDRALQALEAAAFPPEPETPAPVGEESVSEPVADTEEENETEQETAEQSVLPPEEASEEETADEEDTEPAEEALQGSKQTECENDKDDPDADEPAQHEAAADEKPSPVQKLRTKVGRARRLAAKDKSFTIQLIAAVLLLTVLLVTAFSLPEREDSEPEEITFSEMVREESDSKTLYITRIEKPGAPEKEYVPVAGTEVVEKSPLYWGVDVSEHQKEIDWETVAQTGMDFAMVRAGYRGYTEGQIYADEYFKANMRGAENAGLDVGVYFFSQATTVDEAVEEAKFVLEMLKGWNVTYPVVYDWEFIENSVARTYYMTARQVTDCAMAFCETIAYAGYTPMLYFGQNASTQNFDLERLRVFDFWLADYSDSPMFPFDFQMWQYTSSGRINGIDGDVDVNYCFTEYNTTEASQ